VLSGRGLSGMHRTLLAGVLCACLASQAAAQHPGRPESPVIAAASDLQFAVEKVAAAFGAETGHTLRLVFGSSGNFARQIRQGAPFELYLSADEDYVLALARDGFTRDQGTLYAIGRIVVMTPHGSPLEADGTLASLATALDEGRIKRFAIANPDHAPYGKRAEEALRHKGLWEAIRPHLVLGENVSQAAQFAASGNAEGGIVAYSLALAPQVAARGDFELIPEDWHAPLRQRMVLLKDAGTVAERFYHYLQQPAARRTFEQYGLVLPGEPD
jgi:molybdate transport system substrate-binding protein